MEVGEGTYIAKTSRIIGKVKIGKKCSIWENAVIRGDLNSIEIGDGSNIQDCCVLHVSPEHGIKIGRNVSIGHGSIIHGATIEDNCIIGINATILDGCKIGEGSIVAANAVVPPGTEIPPHTLVAGVPAKVIRKDEKLIHDIVKNAEIYQKLAEEYIAGKF